MPPLGPTEALTQLRAVAGKARSQAPVQVFNALTAIQQKQLV